VLDHLAEHDCVEARVRKGKLGDVCANHGSAHPLCQHVAGRSGDIAADDVEAAVFEQSGERATPGAGVEDRPPRPGSQQQVEQESLPQFMPRTEEVLRFAPPIH
jgi:hypothetical protein